MDGVLLIDYLPTKTTTTWAHDAQVLIRLRKVKKKRRRKLSKRVLLLRDNAPSHTDVAQDAVQECGFEVANHPASSPDLCPSDLFLFRHFKKNLQRRRFLYDDHLNEAVHHYFREATKLFSFRE